MRSLIHAEDRPLEGLPPLVALGFRPFFLTAAVVGLVWVPLWLGVLRGAVRLPSHFAPVAWHAHEMLFGYTAAVIAGFLLTATRNWTRLATAHGGSLLALWLLWLAGRVVVFFGAWLPWSLVMGIDVAFLLALTWCVGRPIFRAKSRRNAGIPFVLLGMAAVNVVAHLHAAERLGADAALLARWLMLDGVTILMVVIGGRIIPSFTANALGAHAVPRRERGGWDRLGLSLVVALAFVAALPLPSWVTAWVAASAGAVHLGRMIGWGSHRTWRDPLLWVLHFGWAVIGVALLARAAFAVGLAVPRSVSIHLLTVGAIGSLTLGMMARVALGHTGRALRASSATTAAFASMVLATLLRALAQAGWPLGYMPSLMLSGAAWSVAFLLYLGQYGRVLATPRADGRPG